VLKRVSVLWICGAITVWAGDIALDRDTNLMWEDRPVVIEEVRTFIEARRYCQDLILENYSDWRVPLIDELMTLIDKRYYKPAEKPLFIYSSSNWYWSRSQFTNDKSKAWSINFFNGSDDYRSKLEYQYVRCVRRKK